MPKPTYTPAMLSSALTRYSERKSWVSVRHQDGKAYLIWEGTKTVKATGRPVLYYTKRDATFCTCPGYTYHGDVCSHVIAVNMDNAQAARVATRRKTSAS